MAHNDQLDKVGRRPRRAHMATAAAGSAASVATAALISVPASSVAAFTVAPTDALLAGATLGLLTVLKLVLTGRVLGISGAAGGLVKGRHEAWRVAFVLGLLSGGVLVARFAPALLEVLPPGYSAGRAVSAGLLVGFGTSLGSGCTSGHGLCGNARLSVRSFLSTLTFVATGMLAALVAHTAAVFSLPAGVAPFLAAPASPAARALLPVTLVAGGALASAARILTSADRARWSGGVDRELEGAAALEGADLAAAPPPASADSQKLAAVALASELAVGALFSAALGVSGMLRPSKVAGFLSVLAGSWDPTLALVMGGALLVAAPLWQGLFVRRWLPRPLCAPTYDIARSTVVDAPLLLGAALFGAGWGIGGLCPGPAIVAAVTLQPKVLLFVLAMLAGTALDGATRGVGAAPPKGAA